MGEAAEYYLEQSWDFEEFGEGGDDVLAEHFEATVWLDRRWRWWGRGPDNCELRDLRKAPLPYLINIKEWCEKHNSSNTPYTETRQYGYVCEKIQEKQKWIDLAQKVLRGSKYTWQALKKYN